MQDRAMYSELLEGGQRFLETDAIPTLDSQQSSAER